MGTIRRGVDSAWSPPDSEAEPKYIPGGLVTILADSGGLQADSSGLQADFKVRRGLRAAPRWVGGLSAAD